MVRYELFDHDIEDSLNYIEKIYRWSRKEHSRANVKEPILIGGWAVDAYNSWFGSIDIDLMTNSRTEQSLKFYLRKQEGFEFEGSSQGPKTIFKNTKNGGKISVDFIGYNIPFEGKNSFYLNRRVYIRSPKHIRLRNRVDVLIPDITEPLVYKLKAAWNRSFRLAYEQTTDVEWETGKLDKDYNDIASLIDAPDSLDPTTIHRCFADFPFLKEIIERLAGDSSLFASYIQTPDSDETQIKNRISRIVQDF